MVVSIVFSLADGLWEGVPEFIVSVMLLGAWAKKHHRAVAAAGRRWYLGSVTERSPKRCTPGPGFSFRLLCTAHHWHISLEASTHLQACLGELGGQCWADVGAVLGGAGLAGGWAESLCGTGALSLIPGLTSRAWAAPAQASLALLLQWVSLLLSRAKLPLLPGAFYSQGLMCL